ncbi:MAG: M23 family peptidase [Bdellovibrio sp. CG10_big_fil_rev_8_21_14_0_10_47_8]|nr:MAG: M23 family peptidase [Bdellovibrio sp. CG10_big_fil_rev_8_21_14_0_10_47_8]
MPIDQRADQKKVTLFVVTNDSGQTRKIVLPASWLKAIGLVLGVLILSFTAALVDYMGLLAQTSENKRLLAENAQLTKQFQVVEGKLQALETSLERVKTFTTKLKLITNVDGEDRSMKLAMGATPPANQQVEEFDQPMSERSDATELEKQDQEFMEKKPVNESQGDLAVEDHRDYASLAVRIDKTIKESQLREQSVLDLWESLSERQSLLNSTPNIRPAKGWFTSRFGYRVSPFTGRAALHAGLDIAAAPGSPVYAPADGIVTFAGYDEGYGKMITIDHGYGVTTRFGHNSQIYVQVGQKVSRWDVIASIGNTGRSTGPHVHYEVRVNGVPRDPALYILDE